MGTQKTIILGEGDFRKTAGGYNVNMWIIVCKALGIDPETTESIELKLVRKWTK